MSFHENQKIPTRQQRDDAARARELTEWALDKSHPRYQTDGPDRLLAAAQVYATLAQ